MKKYNQNLNSIPTHKESCCNGLEKLPKESPQLIQKLLIKNAPTMTEVFYADSLRTLNLSWKH